MVLPAGLSWSLQAGRSRLSGWASSRPQVPSTLGTLVPAQRGAGALPSSPFPVLDAPAASCLIAQGQASPVLTSLNVPWWPWLHVPQDTACLTGQTHWQQLSKAGPSLSWRSCPAPQNSSAGQRGRVNLPHCLPRVGFAACVAAALLLRRWRHLCTATAAAALNGTRRHKGGELWGAKPPDPGHGSTQEAESQQALSGEYLQVRQKPVLMSTLFGGLSHHSSTFFLDWQTIYGCKTPTEQHTILSYDSHHMIVHFY